MQPKHSNTENSPVAVEDRKTWMEPFHFLEYSKKKIILALLVITSLLLLAHISVYLLNNAVPPAVSESLDGLFNLSRESNFPTFFSAFLLLMSGLLAAIIYQYKRKTKERFRHQWLMLSLVFMFLSVDEAVQIHERLTTISGKKFDFLNSAFLSFAWVIPYTILFLVVAVYFIKFVLALPKKTRNLFIIAGILYIGGALGFEFIEGYVFNRHGFNQMYWALATVEELMEITGVIVIIYALLDFIQTLQIRLAIKK